MGRTIGSPRETTARVIWATGNREEGVTRNREEGVDREEGVEREKGVESVFTIFCTIRLNLYTY